MFLIVSQNNQKYKHTVVCAAGPPLVVEPYSQPNNDLRRRDAVATVLIEVNSASGLLNLARMGAGQHGEQDGEHLGPWPNTVLRRPRRPHPRPGPRDHPTPAVRRPTIHRRPGLQFRHQLQQRVELLYCLLSPLSLSLLERVIMRMRKKEWENRKQVEILPLFFSHSHYHSRTHFSSFSFPSNLANNLFFFHD